MHHENTMNRDGRAGLLRRMLASWFGRDGGSVPAIPITDSPTAADVARARELIREHGWDHLLLTK
jgi:hypothetical protein